LDKISQAGTQSAPSYLERFSHLWQ